MKILASIILLSFGFTTFNFSQEQIRGTDNSGILYLGQKLPGKSPEVFAPGIISTESHEFSCTFSPDGKQFYFTRRVPEFDRNRVMITILGKAGWAKPEIAPKAGEYEGMEPYITPDGNNLFFQTWRPVEGATKPSMDIWVLHKTSEGWGDPVHLGHPFNPGKSMYFSMSRKGLLFTTNTSEGMGTGSISYSTLKNGEYTDFVNVDSVINSTGEEYYPCIASDERYLLFTRNEDKGKSSIFVSFKQNDSMWGEPKEVELGMECVSMPYLSPDGKYLFFTSIPERLKGDIYWVDAKIIDELRP